MFSGVFFFFQEQGHSGSEAFFWNTGHEAAIYLGCFIAHTLFTPLGLVLSITNQPKYVIPGGGKKLKRARRELTSDCMNLSSGLNMYMSQQCD